MASFLLGLPNMRLSFAAVEMLWVGLQELHQKHEVSTDRTEHSAWTPHKPLSQAALVDSMPGYMAWAWTIRNAIPTTREMLLATLDALPLWQEWLEEMYSSAEALRALPEDQFGWRLLSPSDRSTWPQAGQKVYYFFEVVGTHAGVFEGAGPQKAFPDDSSGGAGFRGIGGTLDVYDVACWAPRELCAGVTV